MTRLTSTEIAAEALVRTGRCRASARTEMQSPGVKARAIDGGRTLIPPGRHRLPLATDRCHQVRFRRVVCAARIHARSV